MKMGRRSIDSIISDFSTIKDYIGTSLQRIKFKNIEFVINFNPNISVDQALQLACFEAGISLDRTKEHVLSVRGQWLHIASDEKLHSPTTWFYGEDVHYWDLKNRS